MISAESSRDIHHDRVCTTRDRARGSERGRESERERVRRRQTEARPTYGNTFRTIAQTQNRGAGAHASRDMYTWARVTSTFRFGPGGACNALRIPAHVPGTVAHGAHTSLAPRRQLRNALACHAIARRVKLRPGTLTARPLSLERAQTVLAATRRATPRHRWCQGS